MTRPPRYLSTKEAAAEYGLTEEYLRRASRRVGGPPSIKIKGLLRFDRAEMDAWIDAQRRQPA